MGVKVGDPGIAWVRELAHAAGEVLSAWAGRLERVDRKGARDLVTDADRQAERLILARIRERFPGHPILAEETASGTRIGPRTWIVDPLDGTTNFVYGIPHYAVSIAWCDETGRPMLGVVHAPALGETFWAVRGEGAFAGERRLKVRPTEDLSEALLATGLAYERNRAADSNLRHIVDLGYRSRCLRRLGSAALDLCYTAMGRFDGYWEVNLSPWDVAAGGLIASEAGAAVSDFSGGRAWLSGESVVAAHPPLARAMRGVLAEPPPEELAGPEHSASA